LKLRQGLNRQFIRALHCIPAKTILSGGSIAMRRSVVIAGLVALSVGAAPALAFQEMPEPPPADVQAATPEIGALQLGTPGGGAAPEAEQGGGLSMFGYTVLPKFDFGLDVMYGQDQQQLDLQGPITDEESGDVTVLGKVKRRF
jgi:hypothetical protein